MWRSGTFLETLQVSSTLQIATTDHSVTERSTSASLGDISRNQKAVPQLYRRNVLPLHTSTQRPGTSWHVRDEFYQTFPCNSTASDKHWGEKAWARDYTDIVRKCHVCSQSTCIMGVFIHWTGLEWTGLTPKSVKCRFQCRTEAKHTQSFTNVAWIADFRVFPRVGRGQRSCAYLMSFNEKFRRVLIYCRN